MLAAIWQSKSKISRSLGALSCDPRWSWDREIVEGFHNHGYAVEWYPRRRAAQQNNPRSDFYKPPQTLVWLKYLKLRPRATLSAYQTGRTAWSSPLNGGQATSAEQERQYDALFATLAYVWIK
ncbi:hypothetical protein SISSUDRAFT_1037362 [Sistotremastrum suecicum HHB10207 ss-3]|uniref:Uncharacterized protein n=1 Tax=Sistotremastrum suecicum HHB10207 ss-3 TaxID=1314776 RepID=A0A165Y8Q2_9AGAM|nr:hypothetical protein SISSUDRAFT_1037362 [Sistotremastrum suecicum HHB10207 ss-3]